MERKDRVERFIGRYGAECERFAIKVPKEEDGLEILTCQGICK